MFNKHNIHKNQFMLKGSFSRQGYDWWWHSFTGHDALTGEEKSFFVEFFIINPKINDGEMILGQKKENKDRGLKPSYMMLKCGCWGENKKQLHRFFAPKEVEIRSGAPYSVKALDCFASETKLVGSVSISEEEKKNHPEWMCDAGSMSFYLTLKKDIAFNVGYGTSPIFRDTHAFEMYWHAEGIKTLFSGEVFLDGRRYVVSEDRSFGYSDKNWGRAFTSPWVWLSSWDLYSEKLGRKLENSAFDIGGGRPRVLGIPLERKLLGGLYYEGECYEFNFSKFWTGSSTQFSFHDEGEIVRWHVEQIASHHKLVSDISCQKKDMLLVNYEEPDGRKRHNNLYNGGTGFGELKLYVLRSGTWVLMDTIKAKHVGCEYGEFDQE